MTYHRLLDFRKPGFSRISVIALSLAVFSTLTVARATVIDLFNTGIGSSGSRLGAGTVQPGWIVTGVAPSNPPGDLTLNPPSSSYVITPNVSWLANSSTSGWISYSSPLYEGGDIYREFTYSLGFQAAVGDDFYMRCAADNGTRVFLNEVKDENQLLYWGSLNPSDFAPFGSWSPWVHVSDLLNGGNSIICVVANLSQSIDNPTGLRAEFSLENPGGSIKPKPSVPDSGSTLALLAISLFGVCVFRVWARQGA